MVLVSWNNDWFVGQPIKSIDHPDWRFILWAACDPQMERVAFVKGTYPTDQRVHCYFRNDPGFVYYPIVRYWGCLVSVQSIRPNTYPREVLVIWDGFPVIPPDFDQWESAKEYGGICLSRRIRIDDLEKEQVAIPDWSLPE